MRKRFSKILVTGGAGFIGSHLVERLLAEDYQVIVLDNLSYGNLKNISNRSSENFSVITCDIRDAKKMRIALKDVEAVFHEAALVSVKLSVQDPLLNNDVNVTGTLNLLKTCVDAGVKRLVFASSAAVYGTNPNPLKKEDMVTSPTNPYGISKLAAENYVKSFNELYGLETISLRYFNAYGPKQSFDLENAYGGVITLFMERLLRNRSPIIYGDGEQTRDFVYVQDIVQANMLALTSKNVNGDFFNIGSGEVININHVAKALKKKLNKEHIDNVYKAAQPGDVKHGYADITKARKTLNYSPKFSFDHGITDLVKWYAKNIV